MKFSGRYMYEPTTSGRYASTLPPPRALPASATPCAKLLRGELPYHESPELSLRNLLIPMSCSASAFSPRGRPKRAVQATVKVESERMPVGLRGSCGDGKASTHATMKKNTAALTESLESIAKSLAPSLAIAASGPTDQTSLLEHLHARRLPRTGSTSLQTWHFTDPRHPACLVGSRHPLL